MNVILLASGKGKRLNPQTQNLPKPLVKVNKFSIFDFFLDSFNDIESEKTLYLATGYKEECFQNNFYQKIFNPEYESSNMLFGLWYTLTKLVNKFEDTIISYGDIIFPKPLLSELSKMDEISIVTDSSWEDNYIGRSEHGFDECEKCIVNENKNLVIASKNLPKQFIKYFEYVGITYIPKRFMPRISELLNELFIKTENLEKPFMFSESLKKAYITDFLSYLVMKNFQIRTKEIQGRWFEIDTIQDLEKARGIY